MRFLFFMLGTMCLVFLSGCSNPLRPRVVDAPTVSTSTTATITLSVNATSTPSVEETNPSIQRTASSTRVIPSDTTGLPLVLFTLDKKQSFHPTGSCQVTRETIEIQSTPLLDEEKRTRLNTILNKAFLTLDRGTSTERVVTLDEFVDDRLRECAATMRELNAMPTDYPSMNDYGYSTRMEATKNSHGILSFRISGYEYTGGAHPNSWTNFVILDAQREKILKLGDVIKEDQLKAFMQQERRALIKEYADALYEDRLSEFRTFVAQPAKTASSTEMTTLSNIESFFLTDTNLVTEYRPYEIAPYSAGYLTTSFPLEGIRSMIRPELVERVIPPKK